MKNNKPRISIKVVFQNKNVKVIASRKIRRINRFIQANNFQNCVAKLTVTYGVGLYNKGEYNNKKDLIYALKVFLEIMNI